MLSGGFGYVEFIPDVMFSDYTVISGNSRNPRWLPTPNATLNFPFFS